MHKGHFGFNTVLANWNSLVEEFLGEPFTSHRKACRAQHDRRFFGTKPGEGEQGYERAGVLS